MPIAKKYKKCQPLPLHCSPCGWRTAVARFWSLAPRTVSPIRLGGTCTWPTCSPLPQLAVLLPSLSGKTTTTPLALLPDLCRAPPPGWPRVCAARRFTLQCRHLAAVPESLLTATAGLSILSRAWLPSTPLCFCNAASAPASPDTGEPLPFGWCGAPSSAPVAGRLVLGLGAHCGLGYNFWLASLVSAQVSCGMWVEFTFEQLILPRNINTSFRSRSI